MATPTSRGAFAAPASPRPYTITISKGSALLPEMRTLLTAWKEGEPLQAFRDRVVAGDLLGKTTARRAADLVERVFARRFLRPGASPVRCLRRILQAPDGTRLFDNLGLVYSARADALLFDVIVELYWPGVREGRLCLSPNDLQEFLENAVRSGRTAKPWSEEVRLRVARGLLRALSDFGLLRAGRAQAREIVLFHPDDRALVYLAHELHFAGLTDAGVVEHPDWGLLGLLPVDVGAALDRLGGDGWWLLQKAGSVVRIDWLKDSMEEVVDVLAR